MKYQKHELMYHFTLELIIAYYLELRYNLLILLLKACAPPWACETVGFHLSNESKSNITLFE